MDIKSRVSSSEWEVRKQLAAAYRIFYYLGFEFTAFGHLSARVPGEPENILLNPFGLMFDEITASSLVKVNKQAKIVLDNGYKLNKAGWNIHSGLLFGNDEINSAMHLHTVDGVAISARKEGILPLCQDSLLIYEKTRYHDYEGIVVDPTESSRMLANLGDGNILLLRNHGTLSVGKTIAEAFFYMFFFEKSCKIQTKATASPGGYRVISQDIIEEIPRQKEEVLENLPHDGTAFDAYQVLFDSWIRRINRLYPDFCQ